MRLAGYVDRYLGYQAIAGITKYDVAHIVDHGYGHLALSLDRTRTVVTFHDALLFRLASGALKLPYGKLAFSGQLLSARAIRRCARVIAVSTSARDDLLQYVDVPPERVRVIHNGVSSVFHFSSKHLPERSPDKSVTLLHVGHSGPVKNLETIIRALPIVARRLQLPVRLWKVGAPLTSAQLQLAEALATRDSVEYLGFLGDPELRVAYHRADVLVMPSLFEGFGLPAAEAMAMGTPVIVSNRGALPEVVADAGVVLRDATDPHELALAVEAIVTDRGLREQLRRCGTARAKHFTWKRAAAETAEVYGEMREV
jgi:glycosyltransferase involved in cell wall biosynthesis